MGRYTPQQLQDLYVLARNVIWRLRLDQYEDEALRSILGALERARRDTAKGMEAWFRSQFAEERDEAILAELDRLTLGIRQRLTNDISEAASVAGEYATMEHADILSFGGKVATFNNIALSPEQFRSFFVTTPMGGALLADWVDRAFDSTVRTGMGEALQAGVLRGEGYPALVRRLLADFEMTKREAITLARTYVQSANVAASQAVAVANADIVRGWKWSATLEPGYGKTGRGTCIRCAALDGQKFKLGEGPNIPLHPRCRCVPIWVTATFRELGLDIDELEEVARPYTMRPDKNIDAGGRRTIEEVGFHQGDYASWFERQSRHFRLNAVGPGRLELLESGKISFADLVDGRGNLKTLKELR